MRLLAVLAMVATSVGCGASDEDRVVATIERFNRAAADGDGATACGELTPAARAPAGGLRCEAVIDQLGGLGGEQAKRRLRAVRVSNVRVRGKRATAVSQIPTQTPVTLELEKVRGTALRWKGADEWKIASLGLAPGGAGF